MRIIRGLNVSKEIVDQIKDTLTLDSEEIYKGVFYINQDDGGSIIPSFLVITNFNLIILTESDSGESNLDYYDLEYLHFSKSKNKYKGFSKEFHPYAISTKDQNKTIFIFKVDYMKIYNLIHRKEFNDYRAYIIFFVIFILLPLGSYAFVNWKEMRKLKEIEESCINKVDENSPWLYRIPEDGHLYLSYGGHYRMKFEIQNGFGAWARINVDCGIAE